MSNINDLLGRESLLAIKDYVDAKDNLIELTWSKLKALRDNSELAAGRFYRIIDFVTTTVQANTSSAGHVFDIIVRADSVNKLNENAYAIQHAGDAYFSNSKLESWQLKYCLDNDTTKFGWADGTNGKGVIYRLIDEFNNDVPYDFKNLLFTKADKYTSAYTFNYISSSVNYDASLVGGTKGCFNNTIKEYRNSNGILQLNWTIFYCSNGTFNCNMNYIAEGNHDNTFTGYGVANNSIGVNFYNNASIGSSFSDNVIGPNFHDNTSIGSSFSDNVIGPNFAYNAIGDTFRINAIGSYFSSNTIDSYFIHNRIDDDFNENTIGMNCQYNAIGSSFQYNTVGSLFSNNHIDAFAQRNSIGGFASNNIIGPNFYGNAIGSSFSYNTIGSNVTNNTIGSSFSYSTIGSGCFYNKVGSSASQSVNVRCCKFDEGIKYVSLTSSTSGSKDLQNVHIHLGVQGTSSEVKTITVARNLSYETNIVPAGTTIIEM